MRFKRGVFLIYTISLIFGFTFWIHCVRKSLLMSVRIEYSKLDHPLDVLVEEQRQNIYFVETTHIFQNVSVVNLTVREACSIETAASLNPNSDVYVLFVSLNSDVILRRDENTKGLLTYKNIKFRHINFEEFLRDTPLDNWPKLNDLKTSQYMVAHASDILRYVVLYKYGGTYLDTDMLLLKTIEDIPPNYAGAESTITVAVGIVNFDSNGTGHKIVEHILLDLKENYKKSQWIANGPGALTKALKNICNITDIKTLQKQPCKSFKVFPKEIFYAVFYPVWRYIFEEKYYDTALKTVNGSIGVHLWNKLSSKINTTIGSKTLYAHIAEKFCPRIYSSCDKYL